MFCLLLWRLLLRVSELNGGGQQILGSLANGECDIRSWHSMPRTCFWDNVELYGKTSRERAWVDYISIVDNNGGRKLWDRLKDRFERLEQDKSPFLQDLKAIGRLNPKTESIFESF